VVLSDEEEMELVQELCKDAEERIGYNFFPKTRKEIEHRIFRFLRESLRTDPDAFYRRFVFRSCYDEIAQKMFPVLLDGYGRITKRVAIGFWGETSPLEELAEDVKYADNDNVFRITLFERSRWPWASPKVSGHISLPESSIEKLAGTVDNFFVAGNTVTIKFHRDFVRVSILDKQEKSNQRIERS
jgi:hypothetical protein